MSVRFSNVPQDDELRPSAVFGRRLKEMRRERGLSQTEIAKRMTAEGRPLNKAAVLRIENGTRRVTLDEAIGLAEVLHVPFVYLLEPPREYLVALLDGRAVDFEGVRRWLTTGDAIRVWPERIDTQQTRDLAAAYLNDIAMAMVAAGMRGDREHYIALENQWRELIERINREAKQNG